MHYYQHHIGDFIRDTSRLTDHQTIAYLRLIWLYYESEKPLENDIPMLAFKIGSDENTVEMLLKCYFNANALHWHHKRIDSEIEAYKNKSEKAKKSAESRWKNTKAMRTHNDSNASAMLTSNQEPVTKNQEPRTNNNTHTQTREREDSKNVDYVDNRFIVKDDLTLAKSDSRVVKNCRTLGLYIEDIDEVDFQQAYMAFLANNTGVRFGSEDAAILKFCSSYLRSAALQKFKRPREQETESDPKPTKIDINFSYNQKHKDLAQELNLAIDLERDKFIDYYLNKTNKKFLDWDAAFRNWLRKAAEFAKTSNLASKTDNQESTQNDEYRKQFFEIAEKGGLL